jgi:hypothetical protein
LSSIDATGFFSVPTGELKLTANFMCSPRIC